MSLRSLGRIAHEQLIFDSDLLRNRKAAALRGSYTFEAAARRLVEGSGLSVSRSPKGVWRISGANDAADSAAETLSDEVVVTGSRIRNANPTSPVHTVTRKEIAESGYSQIGEVLRSLPENFSGGQNPGVFDDPNLGQNLNYSNATTINLRGIGSGATLSLVEGYRLPGDAVFQAADVSGIPLAIVDRIEVVTDGASAIYGSDAVAGVANVLLRKNVNGVEASATLGGATQGGGFEQTYSVLGGVSGSRGFLTAVGEYSHQDPIRAGQREFLSQMAPENTLIQRQARGSVVVDGAYNVSDRLQVTMLGMYSHRATTQVTRSAPGANDLAVNDGLTQNYGLSLALNYKFTDKWSVHVAGNTSRSNNELSYDTFSLGPRYTVPYHNSLKYGEASITGPLITLPGGDLKVALGGGYRSDSYNRRKVNAARSVRYFFGEALVPIVPPQATRTGLNELEMSLAARTERYSDFGDTTNPRVGIRWRALPPLTFRATWSRSFKAPSFDEEYGNNYAFAYDASLLGYSGSGQAILLSNANPKLKPERSQSWTVGSEFEKSAWANLHISATYFHIDYMDRIVGPIYSFTDALTNPIYTPFVTFSPTAAAADAAKSSTTAFYDYTSTGYNAANVVAIVNGLNTNASSQTVDGVDLNYSQAFPFLSGTLAPTADASWLDLRQRTLAGQPSFRLSGLVFNPPSFKARAGVTWSRGGFSATATENHIAGFKDTGVSPAAHVSSWDTVDATVSYAFAAQAGFVQGLKLTVSASNLFDRDPPYVGSAAYSYRGLVFDSANASAIGRFVSVTVSKAW